MAGCGYSLYVEVALPQLAEHTFCYGVPENLREVVFVGARVRVPVRNRKRVGVVVELDSAPSVDEEKVKPIDEVLDADPVIPQHLFRLAGFMAKHYRAGVGQALACVMPRRLLRPDAVYLEPTPLAPSILGKKEVGFSEKALLELLLKKRKVLLPTALVSVGSGARKAVERLEQIGALRVVSRKMAAPPSVDVVAYRLAKGVGADAVDPRRKPAQHRVLSYLVSVGGAATAQAIVSGAPCSRGVLEKMRKEGLLVAFRQKRQMSEPWALAVGSAGSGVKLTEGQEAAVRRIKEALDKEEFAPFLLRGVTGSGKTEVYLRVMEAVLRRGKQAVVLVPEIGMTPATVGAVKGRFGDRVAVLHSAMPEGERWIVWSRMRAGELAVVVGPRSALFAPFPRLGLIVVDEEHDTAYKQDEAPRYNARDMALVLGSYLKIPVVLCSATPSLESIALVARGKCEQLVLRKRVGGSRLPSVEIVDLRKERPESGEKGWALLSSRLLELLEDAILKGEQAILLVPRRGYAPQLLCRGCGWVKKCENCSVAMVVHRRLGRLQCHYCGLEAAPPAVCPKCGRPFLEAVGIGTEKVAELVEKKLDGAKVAILDRDTARRKDALKEVLGGFAEGEFNVLVGTQMVAKGHHFPRVTVTGVVGADQMLGLPDFRAAEHTFQLLTQLAGRAGRGRRPGRVVIQSYYPGHHAIRFAVDQDVESFVKHELRYRRAFGYPPYTRAVLIRFEGADRALVAEAADAVFDVVSRRCGGRVALKGPAPAPIERIRRKWRWQLLLFGARGDLREALDSVVGVRFKKVRIVVDVDPVSTL